MLELPRPTYIDTQDALERWVGKMSQADTIAVDTEADSFHHFREKVCLIQMSALGEDVIVDPLALDSLEPLRGLLADPSRTKLLHDAGYDLIGLLRDFNLQVDGLFDTMWALRLLGERHFGLAAVLRERFDFEADKSLQRSDWARRPLSEKQIRYARFDTHFLIPLVDQLRTELEDCGRAEWAAEDFRRIPTIAAENVAEVSVPSDDAWWRVRGVKALLPEVRGRARALFNLRLQLAERLDRPPFKVFTDAVILDLANDPPESRQDLPRPGLRRGGAHRFGEQIIEALNEAEPVHGRAPPGSGRKRRHGRFLDPASRKVYEALRATRRELAEQEDIEPEVAVGNAVLETIVKSPPRNVEELRFISPFDGWRGELFAPALMDSLLAALES